MEVNMSEADMILVFQNVTGKKRRFYLKNISMKLEPGYIYGLIGENGAGKTTLMKYILNENCKYEGNIYVGGIDIRGNHAKVMNKIGYVSEDNSFFEEGTGEQNARMLGMLYDDFCMERFREVMQLMKVSVSKTYKLMSRGERLKFQLAFAIAHSPCLYLLDEVTAGMDSVFRLEFFEMLRELIKDEKCSILMTSHIMSEIERKTDYVAIMENGQLGEFMESMDIAEKMKEGRYV